MTRSIAVTTAAFLLAAGLALACAPADAKLPRKHTLRHDGMKRVYFLKTPSPKKHPGKRPLVLVLHGGGGTAFGMMRFDERRMQQLADEHGFFVAWPAGYKKSWNDGRKVTKAAKAGVDDLGFLAALVDHLAAKHPIKRDAVFSTGISNGGFMSLRLACSRPDMFRGVAPVTAQGAAEWAAECTGASKVGLLLVNGTGDPLIPYAGGDGKVLGSHRGVILSTDETLAGWRARLGCSDVHTTTALPNPHDDGVSATRTVWEQCTSGSKVGLVRVEGGGHVWPGGSQYLPQKLIGKATRDFNASDEIVRFFASLL